MEGSVSLRLIAAVIGFTLLSEVISVQSCPTTCLCYVDEGGLRTANCSGLNFINENKYNKVFHEIDVLNLRMENDYEPLKLWDDMFVPFAKLKILNLDDCRISYLPKNVFKGLKKIYEINLASNEIKHFDNAVFENLYTLNKLNLKGNQLQGSTKPFISSSSLRELDLSYCGITNLQNEFFHGVKKVARLYLDGNHLQTVKEHILPRGLTHLNLANNRIVNVPVNAIHSLNQLRWLDLGANPVNCTCSLINLQDMLSGRAIIMDGDLRCAYPPELENMKLSKVNENEVCYKEIFSTRFHFKKSQASKFSAYHKKDYYFENEKYNPFELQGDDPGTSTDDYAEENEYNYDKSLTTVSTALDDKNKHDKIEADSDHVEKSNTEPENLVDTESDITDKQNKEEEVNKTIKFENTLTSHSSKLEEPLHVTTERVVNNEGNEDAKLHNIVDNQTENSNNTQVSEIVNKTYLNNTDTENKEGTDSTQPPYDLEDDEGGEVPIDETPHKEVFDDNMKDDEVMPVSVLPQNELINSSEKPEMNATTEKIPINIIESSDIAKIDDSEGGKEDDEESKKIISEMKVSTEGTIDHNNDKHENNFHEAISGIVDINEVEGSGDGIEENITINVSSIPLFHEEIHEITEEAVHKTDIQPDETHSKISAKSSPDDNESVGQIVDKKPIDYEEMGPHIVVGCIIIFIVVLLFISVYKGLCKSKETNRKPLSDVEANNGTELEDITSLLNKTPIINDEKHNNKYPNEVPSSETINLLKPDKTDELNGTNMQNNSHDLNQNDSKDDVIVKNGKPRDSSPPPIEKTKAKLTVLLESIPRTPIFVQKHPGTLNNGIS